MIRECGEVIASDGTTLRVRCASRRDCPRCAAGEGCGGGVMSWLLRERLETVDCRFEGPPPEPGQRVTVALDERSLLVAAAVAYLLPLFGLILGAVVGRISSGGDLSEVIAAATGLVIGLLAARALAATDRLRRMLTPKVEMVG